MPDALIPPSIATRLRALEFTSPVGAWRLCLWTPSPDLAEAVVALWATEAQTVAFRERVLPRETVELMINFGGRQTVHGGDGDAPRHFRRHWVSGLQTRCLEIESPTAAQLIAASLKPAHAGPLLGLAGREIASTIVPLDDILGRAADELATRLEETPSIPGRFLLFEDFLRDRRRRGRLPHPTAARAVERILDTGGQVQARALREELGCSARYLEQELGERVGLSPKQLARLVRFSRVVERIRVAPHVDWTAVALDCGFYDQSHFNREFRAFTGTTPTGFLALRDPSTQGMILD